MRYYTYVEPGEDGITPEYHTVSEEEIRKTYWPYWYRKMSDKYGKKHVDENYCFEDCLSDWVIVNWAWESE